MKIKIFRDKGYIKIGKDKIRIVNEANVNTQIISYLSDLIDNKRYDDFINIVKYNNIENIVSALSFTDINKLPVEYGKEFFRVYPNILRWYTGEIDTCKFIEYFIVVESISMKDNDEFLKLIDKLKKFEIDFVKASFCSNYYKFFEEFVKYLDDYDFINELCFDLFEAGRLIPYKLLDKLIEINIEDKDNSIGFFTPFMDFTKDYKIINKSKYKEDILPYLLSYKPDFINYFKKELKKYDDLTAEQLNENGLAFYAEYKGYKLKKIKDKLANTIYIIYHKPETFKSLGYINAEYYVKNFNKYKHVYIERNLNVQGYLSINKVDIPKGLFDKLFEDYIYDDFYDIFIEKYFGVFLNYVDLDDFKGKIVSTGKKVSKLVMYKKFIDKY